MKKTTTTKNVGAEPTININQLMFKSKKTIFKLLDEAKKYLDENKLDDYIIYSIDRSNDGIKNFKIIKFTDRLELLQQNKHQYELLYENKNVKSFKLYFDLDKKIDELNNNLNDNNFLDNIIVLFSNKINDYFNKKYELNNELNIIIMIASTDKKYSYHILFNNILFKNLNEMKNEIEQIKQSLNEDYIIKNKFIDTSVYKSNQQFRLFNNSKMGTNNTLQILKYYHQNINDISIINNSFIGDINEPNILIDISNINTDNKNKKNTIKIDNNNNDNNNNNELTTKIKTKQLDLIEYLKNNNYEKLLFIFNSLNDEYLNDFNKWITLNKILKHFNIDYKIIDEINKKSSKYNEINNKKIIDNIKLPELTYELYNKYIRIILKYLNSSNKTNFDIIFNEIKKFNLFIEEYNNYYDKKKYNQIENFYEINIDEIKNEFDYIEITKNEMIFDIEKNKYYLNKNLLMNNFNFKNYDVIMLKSFMGSGKNQNIYNYIQQTNIKSILIISTKIIYTKNIINEFKKYCNIDFINYQNSKKYDDNYLCCSIYSLSKIENDKNYDLIILDEVESVLNSFNSSKCHINLNNNFNKLKSLIKNSKKIIICDRDINNTSIDFIKNMENKKKLFINNTFYPYTHICNHYKNETTLYNKMIDDIKNNKKIVIFHNEKERLKQFKNEIENLNLNKKIVIHYSNSDDNNKLKTISVNELWKCDILLYNISITVGISFDEVHFDNIYCFVHNANMRDFFQSTARVRKINSNELNIYINKKTSVYDKTINDVKYNTIEDYKIYDENLKSDMLEENYKYLLNILSKDAKLDIENQFKSSELLNYFFNKIDIDLFNVRKRTMIEQKLNENPFIIFKYFLKQQNYNYNYYDDKINNTIKKIKQYIFTNEEYKKIIKIYNEFIHIYFDDTEIKKFIDSEYRNINSIYNFDDLKKIKQLIHFKKKFQYNIEDEYNLFSDYLDKPTIYNNYYYFNSDFNILEKLIKKIDRGDNIQFIKNPYAIEDIKKNIFSNLKIDNPYNNNYINIDELNNTYNYINENIKLIKNIFNFKTDNIKKKHNIPHYILKSYLKTFGLIIKKSKKNDDTYNIFLDEDIHILNYEFKIKKYNDDIQFIDENIDENINDYINDYTIDDYIIKINDL